ncbi:hypothetical protein P8452_52987 [Trifolium repens]|nr:hypothetical protein P8452_52987 [Trifolium repens]
MLYLDTVTENRRRQSSPLRVAARFTFERARFTFERADGGSFKEERTVCLKPCGLRASSRMVSYVGG